MSLISTNYMMSFFNALSTFVVIWLCLINTLVSCNTGNVLRVGTSTGLVRGFERSVAGEVILTYLGIPYAEPPTGANRFMPPKPKKPWAYELNATEFGYSCYQLLDEETFPNFSGADMWNPKTNFSEDCLTLNIWVPRSKTSKKAVMVWIYGGGFVTGATAIDVYDGAILAATQDVVVVSLNYRLGALGFLALNSSVSGNMGLFDQQLALTWIKNNINYFEGDNSKITIFGESAGAVSVGLHLFSNASNSLFKRAIMQSGSPTTPWAVIPNDIAHARGLELATLLGCYECDDKNSNKINIEDIVACMRLVDASVIVANEWVQYGVYIFPFGPVVDGSFLTALPSVSLENGSVKPASIMLGSNLNEASYYMVYYLSDYFSKDKPLGVDKTQFRDMIKMILTQANNFEIDAVEFQYTNWLEPTNGDMFRDATDEWMGDYNIKCQVYGFGLDYADLGNRVHAYYFTHRPQNSPWHEWMGAIHGEEIAFVFGQPLQGLNFTDEEKQLSKKMMKLWADFSKKGKDHSMWPKFKRAGQQYIELSVKLLNSTIVQRGPRANKCALWKEYLPKLARETADINESEMEWKEEFYKWSNKYMVDWKAEFNHYVTDKENRCSGRRRRADDDRNEL